MSKTEARFLIIQSRDLKFGVNMCLGDTNLHAKNCGPVIHILATRGHFVEDEIVILHNALRKDSEIVDRCI